ncbi:MAG: ABC transporter permease, partial [bacterium]|nr:ABC transporter permease [bacterium]
TNPNKFYPNGFSGTAIVDKKYLSNKFNNGEEIEVLAGDIDDTEHKTGVILTDYLVDGYNDYYKTNLEYKDFIGQFSPKHETYRKSFYCIAVIKTDYKEKYKDLYDEYIRIKNNGYLYDEVLNFTQKKDYEDYVNQIVNGEIGVAYTLNQNFLNDVEENDEYCNILLLCNLFLSLDETTIIEQLRYDNFLYVLPSNDLNDNEIIINKEFANKLIFAFNSSDIIGKDLYVTKTISNYYLNQKEDSIKLKIVGISNNTLVNTATKNKINSLHRKEIARIIPLKNINKVAISKIIKNDVITMDSNSSAYGFVNQVITLYHNIFLLVKFILLSMITIYHVVYSLKSIKDKHYQIGVFKSLGINNSTISFIFVGKTIIVAIATLLIVSLIAYPFLTLANHLLISSYTSVFEYSFKKLNVFYFHPIIFVFYYLFNLLLFFAISFIPVFVLRKIEPAKIVNDAND